MVEEINPPESAVISAPRASPAIRMARYPQAQSEGQPEAGIDFELDHAVQIAAAIATKLQHADAANVSH